jgi:poly [ADP-ribose] polymerase 2/3/4
MEIFHVRLKQNKKYYNIKINKIDENFIVKLAWGRTVCGEYTSENIFINLEGAMGLLCQKFKDKTGNNWDQKDNFQIIEGKYVIDYLQSFIQDE